MSYENEQQKDTDANSTHRYCTSKKGIYATPSQLFNRIHSRQKKGEQRSLLRLLQGQGWHWSSGSCVFPFTTCSTMTCWSRTSPSQQHWSCKKPLTLCQEPCSSSVQSPWAEDCSRKVPSLPPGVFHRFCMRSISVGPFLGINPLCFCLALQGTASNLSPVGQAELQRGQAMAWDREGFHLL